MPSRGKPQSLGDRVVLYLAHRIVPNMQVLALNGEEFRPPFCLPGETFMAIRPESWDSEKIGAGSPPLKTRRGWLQIYHGVGQWNGKKAYRLGAVLSSPNNLMHIVYRSPNPILEPGGEDEGPDEAFFQKQGWVPNVVFTCGAVPKEKDSLETLDDNDEVIVYYGAADQVLCAAVGTVSDLVQPSGKLRRVSGNPILLPRQEALLHTRQGLIAWERLVYNAGAFRLNGTTFILYRALGEDGVSRIGLAWTRDGLQIDGRLPFPIFGPKEPFEMPSDANKRRELQMQLYQSPREVGGTEDPRITLIGDRLFMTYSAYGDGVRIALAGTTVKDFLAAWEGAASYHDWENLWHRWGILFPWEDKDGFLFSPSF
ncbi:MAG: hypothetical protein NZ959_07820 [Armatimonadetes bacterium]|nr:hypothetical protein [Armatimonadota bacterium]MDW8121692.1 hypothetical protein [Armatimonadota bacterium]